MTTPTAASRSNRWTAPRLLAPPTSGRGSNTPLTPSPHSTASTLSTGSNTEVTDVEQYDFNVRPEQLGVRIEPDGAITPRAVRGLAVDELRAGVETAAPVTPVRHRPRRAQIYLAPPLPSAASYEPHIVLRVARAFFAGIIAVIPAAIGKGFDYLSHAVVIVSGAIMLVPGAFAGLIYGAITKCTEGSFLDGMKTCLKVGFIAGTTIAGIMPWFLEEAIYWYATHAFCLFGYTKEEDQKFKLYFNVQLYENFWVMIEKLYATQVSHIGQRTN